MLLTLMDNKNLKIRADRTVNSSVTKLEINGSYLEIEGYASFEGIESYQEDRIRKTLYLVPDIDVEKIREEQSENTMELEDQEILEQYIIKIPLDNCALNELGNGIEIVSDNKSLLAGYKATINLSVISSGKPLKEGNYNVYIKIEQMLETNDQIKYEKLISLSDVRKYLNNDILNTKLNYFSATKVMKYNLLAAFNKFSKTLELKNTLLQEFDPRDLPDNTDTKENKYLRSLKRKFFKVMYTLFSVLPINKRKVTFASDSRSELNGNFFFVYEELYKRNLNLDIRFVFNERINNKKNIMDLMKIAYEFATSKIILLDDFYPLVYPLKIRKNADLIQVWHAAGAFKTFGYSRMGRPGSPSAKSKNHKNYTKVAVSSEGVRENYAEGFGIAVDKVFPTGVPRSDIFFDENYKSEVQQTLYNKYPFIKNKKVILFAPTFRGNGQSSANYPFEVLNLKRIYEEFHEEYVFLFKIHPFVNNKLTIPYEYADFFYDFSDYREINDLLLITDLLITDYSSVCFEFALLNKPMLFFAYDVEEYIESRDFYYDFFDFIPGPLVRTTEEIINRIKGENYQLEKIKPFVKYFFGETLGHASANVVDQLIIPSLDSTQIDVTESDLTPPKSRIDLFQRSLDK
ncbi:CDP-glycerol glycerophosphotransferase family protein [Ornithinibacillus contaminans]|uniref:CDP-glycerol glycerophosphotransferase family protein n=1 Tax=Ornithinibacillus contaminans TaxID=694055 RepID=UPI0007ECEE54|nr:CDP-glycerol glycerophosphotransferase family protein [Ornithinibacillus contaminans]